MRGNLVEAMSYQVQDAQACVITKMQVIDHQYHRVLLSKCFQ